MRTKYKIGIVYTTKVTRLKREELESFYTLSSIQKDKKILVLKDTSLPTHLKYERMECRELKSSHLKLTYQYNYAYKI